MTPSDSRVEDIEKKVEGELVRYAHLYDEYNTTIEKAIQLIQDFRARVAKGKQ